MIVAVDLRLREVGDRIVLGLAPVGQAAAAVSGPWLLFRGWPAGRSCS